MAEEQQSSSIVTATSKPSGQSRDNSNIITASSKHGFSSAAQQTQEVTPVVEQTSPQPTQKTVQQAAQSSFQEAMQEKTTPNAEREAAKLMKTLMQSNLNNLTAGDFQTGSMLFYRYDAKDKEKTYDKTPLVMILRKSKGYVLGLNFHWTPVILRVTLMKLILKLNKQNIINNRPIQVSYEMLKPFITSMGLGPVIRLYIFKRISRRGIRIPETHWLIAARLRSESFNNGESAENAYKKAVQAYKSKKASRGARQHTWR